MANTRSLAVDLVEGAVAGPLATWLMGAGAAYGVLRDRAPHADAAFGLGFFLLMAPRAD